MEGSPDSLAALIDRLTAQLLARGAGETRIAKILHDIPTVLRKQMD